MTLLARRRDELREAAAKKEVSPSERHGPVVRPRPPQRGFLHVHGALGNGVLDALLRSGLQLAGAPAPRRPGRERSPVGERASFDRAAFLGPIVVPRARFIVPDGVAPGAGQMRRSSFLGALREAARDAAEGGLAPVGQTARGCPWIEHYFRIYARLTAERIEADLRRYAPATRRASSAEELLAHAEEHVRASVRHWTTTGELAGVPRGLPGIGVLQALGGSLAGVGRLVERARLPGAAAPSPALDLDDPAAVEAELGPGRSFPVTARTRMERAFGQSFSDVRIHDDPVAARLAGRLRARAFAVGPHVAFDRGEYRPGTPVGDALLAHELAHVTQQSHARRPSPARGGARALDRDADGAAGAAVARLWLRGRALPAQLARPARPRLRAGLSLQRCGKPNSDTWFHPYRDRFNRLWNQEPYKSMDSAFDPRLTSKGPPTQRSREIFEELYLVDAELRKAYDEDKGGLRERIDTYTGPEGLNLIDSPRLKALEQAFSRFEPPVEGRKYQELKTAVAGVAGALDDADRQAINLSNEWDLQINRYVKGADKRREIRLLINPPVKPADTSGPPDKPEEELTQAEKLKRFFLLWSASLRFKRGLDEPSFIEGVEEDVRYEDRRQLFRIHSSSAIENPGQVLYVRVRVGRGSTVIASPDPSAFPVGQKRMPVILVPIEAPATVPADGDRLVFDVDLLEGDLATVQKSRRFEVTVKEQTALTRAEAEKVAAEDDRYLNDPTPSGLLGKMSANAGIQANVSEAIRAGRLTFHALTERHDSGVFVTAKLRRSDPKKVGYFAGPTYGPGDSRSFVSEPGDGFSLSDFGPRFIVANRTPDLRKPGQKRPDAEIIEVLVHEAVHALDVQPGANTTLERYKTEFRAYWMDGHVGPPLEGTCPPDKKPKKCTDLRGSCLDTAFCAELPPPGPKTPRSRSIFNHMYGSATYDYVKPAYDENVDGFRRAVDQYVIPDGIDLIASIRLDDLRALIDGWNGIRFENLRSRVRAYFRDEGSLPPHGRLSEEEKAQVRGNRAWRNVVERAVKDKARQNILKHDLGIPQ